MRINFSVFICLLFPYGSVVWWPVFCGRCGLTVCWRSGGPLNGHHNSNNINYPTLDVFYAHIHTYILHIHSIYSLGIFWQRDVDEKFLTWQCGSMIVPLTYSWLPPLSFCLSLSHLHALALWECQRVSRIERGIETFGVKFVEKIVLLFVFIWTLTINDFKILHPRNRGILYDCL